LIREDPMLEEVILERNFLGIISLVVMVAIPMLVLGAMEISAQLMFRRSFGKTVKLTWKVSEKPTLISRLGKARSLRSSLRRHERLTARTAASPRSLRLMPFRKLKAPTPISWEKTPWSLPGAASPIKLD
jgi:hypothetical protein